MNKTKFLICSFLGLLLLSGCSVQFKTKDTSGVDGGLFVSVNKGQTWGQALAVPTVKGVESLASLDVASIALDPSDANAVYFGSVGKGLYYAYNLGLGWQKAQSLPEGTVNAVAVVPDNKCGVYAAVGNKLFLSEDCNRTYNQVYYDNDPQTEISAVAIDHYDTKRIYIGTSKGDVLRSSDKGVTWQTVLRAGFRILKITLSPQDSRLVFISTNGDGMQRSSDAGENWIKLRDNMKEFPNSHKVMDFVISPTDSGLIMAVTANGMLKTVDNGDTWSKIELITSEKDATINTLTINPKDSKEIYYATKTTFYSSFDGGVSWSAKKLPSSRGGWKMVVKPDQPNIIFMGMKKFKQ